MSTGRPFRCHTICYAPGPGRIYTFGLGGSGQLGIPALPSSVATPTQLPGKWIQVSNVKYAYLHLKPV